MPQDRAHRSEADGDPSGGADGRGAGTYFLGRYRVVDEIGIGGMASVHLARMDGPGGFQKWVAIKRIHPHLVEDQTFIHMFLDEARIAARISHPNVATVFDLGEHEDTYWIAMEYLHGEPLREVMRRTEEITQPMPPEIACRVIADAAEGLHAAHELLGKNGEKLGLVHRDVTPHNLFVTYDGTTKVVDFGIAKFSSRMSSTRAGTLKGKLAYMSPEQVHGETIDRRTDLFALGVVLWELTTGQRLFRMESDLDTLAKVQECNVPRPSSILRGYPMDLEKIVMKALAKNRGERFKTAREFSRALQSLLMRRGLFIASDEVAAYMQTIFTDRIKKREAHLRWAAEVTQTINLEGMLTRPPQPIGHEASAGSYSSEVQPQPPAAAVTSRVPAVRPAAGLPPLAGQGGDQVFEGAKALVQTHASSPTKPRGGAARADTLRPPAKNAPLPAAVADDDDDLDDGPTLQASPQARAAMMAAHVPDPPNLGGGDDDLDDNDDTIVTTTRVELDRSLNATAAPRTPIPAAGMPPSTQRGPGPGSGNGAMRENVAFAAPPRSAPPRAPAAPQLPAVVVSPQTAPPMFPVSQQESRSTAHVDALLAEALAEQRGPAPRPPSDLLDPARTQPITARHQPTAPRLFAPPTPDLHTDTARAVKRPPPMWMVALGSGLAALFAAGLVILFAAWTTKRQATPVAVTPVPVPTAVAVAPAHTIPAVAHPDATSAGGPFGAARTQFVAAIATPTGATPPAPTPAPPATGSAAPVPAPPTMNAVAAVPAAPAPAPVAAPPTPVVAAPPPSPPLPLAAAPAPRSYTARRVAPQPLAPKPAPAPAATGGDQGQLTIICFPACEAVFDNGQQLGPSPIFKRSVPVGEHRLRMTSTSPAVTKVVSVIVMGDQTTTVRQPMTP